MQCRINKRRIWTARLLLERQIHPGALFLTLTYDEDRVPLVAKTYDSTLRPRDATLFLKRLRKRRPFRYFLVGEYGDKTQRPHYHAIVYGDWFEEDCRRFGRYVVHPDVQEAWGQGFTSAFGFTPERAAYVAGYTVKKYTKPDSTYLGVTLGRRVPEFTRQSRRPGIGCHDDVIRALSESLVQSEPLAEDMPPSFRYGSTEWPMPPIVAAKCRYEMGMARLAVDRPPRRVVENYTRSAEDVAASQVRLRRLEVKAERARRRREDMETAI